MANDNIAETSNRMLALYGRHTAISRLEGRLSKWTGDTRCDGNTPKEFWEAVLNQIRISA